jgi:anti-anti-sigma factor
MLPTDFSVSVGRHRDVVRLAVEGELDLATAPTLSAHLEAASGTPGRAVVVDLERLTFLDSSGVALLLRAARRATAEGWTLSIVRTPAQALSVLKLCGLLDALPLDAAEPPA